MKSIDMPLPWMQSTICLAAARLNACVIVQSQENTKEELGESNVNFRKISTDGDCCQPAESPPMKVPDSKKARRNYFDEDFAAASDP